jgi:hypothetical protein
MSRDRDVSRPLEIIANPYEEDSLSKLWYPVPGSVQEGVDGPVATVG